MVRVSIKRNDEGVRAIRNVNQRRRTSLVAKTRPTTGNMHPVLYAESSDGETEAFFHFLEWYATCLKESHDIGCNTEEYEEIESCEKLMLKYTMMLIHWKKWDGEKNGLV